MKQKKKLTDDGFSIIEAMVAIVILSIIFIPIANSFVSSIKASQETKIMQEATSTAQSIMEDFKNSDLVDLFNDYVPTSVVDATGAAVSISSDAWTKAKMQKLITKETNKCCDFTVDIELSKSSSDAKTDGVNDINSYEIPQIYSMDSPSTLILNAGEIPYWVKKQVLIDLHGEANVEGKTEAQLQPWIDAVISNIDRTFSIAVSEDGATKTETEKGNTAVVFKITYQYNSTPLVTETLEDVVLTTELKNLYLYYTPGYDGERDQLTFENNDHINGNLYVITNGTHTADELREVACSNLNEFKVATTVNMTGTVPFFVSAESDFVPDKKKETRRYEIKVTVKKTNGEKVYSSMISTRGE